MALEINTIERLGDELFEALSENRTVPNLRDRNPGMDIVDGYRVQERMISRRLAAGETIVGKKIGVTSKAVQQAIGVFEPDFGQLTSAMVVEDGAAIDLDTLIQPQAEGEIAFVLKHDLVGPGVTATDVVRATDYVTACFEIVDSRINDWDTVWNLRPQRTARRVHASHRPCLPALCLQGAGRERYGCGQSGNDPR